MLTTLFGAALLTAAATPLASDDVAKPRGKPPQVMAAAVDDGGRPYVESLVIRHVPEVRVVEVKKGDKIEKVEQKVFVPVMEQRRQYLDEKGVRVFGTDGQQVRPENLPNFLRQGAPVLVSADGEKVDPFYLKLAREGTLIVVFPKPAAPAPKK